MNQSVPDFEMDKERVIASSSNMQETRQKKSSWADDDDIMELLWQNGQIVVQNQSQRSSFEKQNDAVVQAEQPAVQSSTQQQQQQQLVFMQEDEMASWLHYPLLEDSSFDQAFADFLYSTPVANMTDAVSVNELRPPRPPAQRRRPDTEAGLEDLGMLSRQKAKIEPECLKNLEKDAATIVKSIDVEGRVRTMDSGNNVIAAGTSSAGGERTACKMTVTSSSPGGSSASTERRRKLPAEDQKRKGSEGEDVECHSKDVEFKQTDVNRQVHGSTSSKRSRAAEVHNQLERRRRDRINEKMRALQELIPRCNKSDKASMLDEAIEYLKSLQLQVKIMSMCGGMVPMMFHGAQPYMMPMGMGMGMNRPMMPFPNVLAGSAFPTPAATAHLAPRFPMPPLHMPPALAADPLRNQTNQSNLLLNTAGAQNLIQLHAPPFTDPYQQYMGLAQMQQQLPQNRPMAAPIPSSSGTDGANRVDHPQSG